MNSLGWDQALSTNRKAFNSSENWRSWSLEEAMNGKNGAMFSISKNLENFQKF